MRPQTFGGEIRLTEYIHWINRTDIGVAEREKNGDYHHLTMYTKYKRDRYIYQCMLKGKEPVK